MARSSQHPTWWPAWSKSTLNNPTYISLEAACSPLSVLLQGQLRAGTELDRTHLLFGFIKLYLFGSKLCSKKNDRTILKLIEFWRRQASLEKRSCFGLCAFFALCDLFLLHPVTRPWRNIKLRKRRLWGNYSRWLEKWQEEGQTSTSTLASLQFI